MQVVAIILSFFFVTFTDKGGSSRVALSEEAKALRAARGIAIDSLDYAVNDTYVEALKTAGARVCYTSRWINGATVYCHKAEIDAIKQLPFVKEVQLTRGLQEYLDDINNGQKPRRHIQMPDKRGQIWSPNDGEDPDPEPEYPNWDEQLKVYNLLPLHEAGYQGQGITIGVIDDGFWNLSTAAAFDSMRTEGRLLGAFDFSEDGTGFEDGDGEHGAVCLGLIGGHTENYQGAAIKAKFYALKSEENGIETAKEPDNWIAAIEACDSLGVWITSTSLGYWWFDEPEVNFSYDQMDGKTIRASRAATIAARKGMLLCIAAGNTGQNGEWPWIGVPADADSILTVGAVGYDSIATLFSSIGPTADGRIKPDVCAVGAKNCLISANTGSLYYGNGTSFATPLIAGLAACLWSAFPNETNMQIRERIIRSAHRYDTPDNQYGYGIPDAWKAYNATGTDVIYESANLKISKCLEHGQVIIIRDGVRYNILGQQQ